MLIIFHLLYIYTTFNIIALFNNILFSVTICHLIEVF